MELIESKGMLDISPGKEIAMLIKQHGWDQIDLAEIMRVSESTISNLVKGKTQINHYLSEVLSIVLGMSPEYWLMRQSLYNQRINQDIDDFEKIKKNTFLFRLFPVREMLTAGLIKGLKSAPSLEEEIIDIIGRELYQNLFDEYSGKNMHGMEVYKLRLRMSELLWVCWAMRLIPNINNTAFNMDKLMSIELSLDSYLIKLDGFVSLLNDLHEAGVALWILPHIPKHMISGSLIWNINPMFVYAYQEDTFQNFINYLRVMLKICSRYRPSKVENTSSNQSSYVKGSFMGQYKTPFGIRRIFDLECLIGAQPYRPIESNFMDEIQLIPDIDIPVLYDYSVSSRKVKTPFIGDNSLRIKFPPGFYLPSLDIKNLEVKKKK